MMLASKQLIRRAQDRLTKSPPATKAAPPITRAATPARKTATNTAIDIETAARLRAVIGKLSRRLRPTAAGKAAGLTPTKISVLMDVVRRGPLRLAEVAEAEGINPTMLSRVIADLVQQRLLERTSDQGDRRAAWVKATAAGRRLSERMRRERTDALDVALAELDAEDRRQILDSLTALEHLAEVLKGRRP
jgi:DNA-binding MarR family transcriptional regulator